MGQPQPLFLFIFGLFRQTFQMFTTNICEKMSIQDMVPGFEPRPLECESPPIITRPGLPSKDIFLTTISPIANNTIPQCDTYPKSQASAALGGIIPT